MSDQPTSPDDLEDDDLVPMADVDQDPYFEDDEYDEANDELDPTDPALVAEPPMGPKPTEES